MRQSDKYSNENKVLKRHGFKCIRKNGVPFYYPKKYSDAFVKTQILWEMKDGLRIADYEIIFITPDGVKPYKRCKFKQYGYKVIARQFNIDPHEFRFNITFEELKDEPDLKSDKIAKYIHDNDINMYFIKGKTVFSNLLQSDCQRVIKTYSNHKDMKEVILINDSYLKTFHLVSFMSAPLGFLDGCFSDSVKKVQR